MSNAALISQRTAGLPGNPFAKADARAAAAIAAGEDVIDLSKGNPDGQPPAFVQDALAHAAHDPSLFRYPSFDGLPEYLNAIAGWYESKHGVSVDPATQLLATSGSSVGIATVIQALIDPGETVVAVNPYYSQYEGSTAVAGGRFETIPADPARGFLPDLDAVDPAECVSVCSNTPLSCFRLRRGFRGLCKTSDRYSCSAATIGHLIGQTSLNHTISYWSGLGRQM